MEVINTEMMAKVIEMRDIHLKNTKLIHSHYYRRADKTFWNTTTNPNTTNLAVNAISTFNKL